MIAQSVLFLTLCLHPGCTSAHPDDLLPQKQIANSTNDNQFQLKPRPSYISSAAQAKLQLQKAIEIMRNPAPINERKFYTTKEESNMSFSIGDTRDGYLINGQPLPMASLSIRQLPVQYERGLTYATPQFIKLLTDTAKTMQKKYPGTIMYMGNMSAREGGDIPYSVSHNSGRDGDIAFYYLDENGKFAHPDNLYKVNKHLQARTKSGILTFDLEKNTTLIETLITHPKIDVQFIFLAKYIRTAIHKELIRRGASEELLERFEKIVIIQAAHNDHFHVRTYCADTDICAGCIDKSYIHDWHEDPVPKQQKCVEKHLAVLSSKKSDAEHQAAALQRLSLHGAVPAHESKILKFLNSDNTDVRTAAALASHSLNPSAAKALSERLKIEKDQNVRHAIIEALATIDSAETRQTFNEQLAVLAKSGAEPETFKTIIKFISQHPHPDHLQPLYQSLQTSTDSTYMPILFALNVTVNRDFCKSTANRTECLEKIGNWIGKNGEKSRQFWLTSGFQSGGFKVSNLSNKDIPILLDAISGPRPLSYNAQLILKKLGKLAQNSLDWPVSDAVWHYTRFFKRHSKKYKINLNDRDEKGNKLK